MRLLVAAVLMLAAVRIYAAASARDQHARPASASASAAQGSPDAVRPRVLIFTRTAGYRHASIPHGIRAMRERLGAAWVVEHSEDPSIFTREGLAPYRVIVFLSTTGDVLDDAQQQALTEWVLAGGGWIGIHAAADTEQQWPWYGDQLCCARFVAHPDVQTSTVVVEDREHPSTFMLPGRWRRTDEWYVYDRSPRGTTGVRVLASMDGSTITGPKMQGDHPIAWCRDLGNGRAWYTGGGHTSESFTEPLFMDHIEGGVRWAARIESAPPVRDHPAAGAAVAHAGAKPASGTSPQEPTR